MYAVFCDRNREHMAMLLALSDRIIEYMVMFSANLDSYWKYIGT